MAKNVTTDLSKMLHGINLTCDTVRVTLGPKGRNIAIGDPMESKITNDGVTIAASIILEDPEEEFGAYLVKNVCSQTNDNAGDGTTTTAVLFQSLIHESRKRSENPMELRSSLSEASKAIVEAIKKQSKPIKTDKQIEQVATLSAENPVHGRMIADIIKKVGEEGVITVEDSRTSGTTYELVEGYEAHVGFMSPYFITDKKSAKAVYDDVHVAVFESAIKTVADIKYLGEVLQAEKIDRLVLVCHDIEPDMLNNLVVNYLQRMNGGQGLKNVVIRAASADLLQDIAAVVGATVIGGQGGVTFDKITPRHLGKADKVSVGEKSSLFFCKTSKALQQAKRLEELGKNVENAYEKKKYFERAAKLRGRIAVIRVGAPTDTEKWYLKHKLEDAVNATQSAIEEGIVEGGGMCLYRIAEGMNPKTVGEEILKKVLTAPLRTIIENAGKDYVEIVKNIPKGKGYDARKDVYSNLIKEGIIDPTKVERAALENSVSSAGIFLTTHSVITDLPQKHDKQNS